MNLATFTAVTLLAATAAEAGETVVYQNGGETFQGYFAAAENPRGTVVVLPTWKGISDYEKDRAQMLAEAGYNAFAGDLHGQGKLPANLDEMKAGYAALMADPERIRDLGTAIFDQADSLGGGEIIFMGYSMGGGVVMEMARSGRGDALGVDGYVLFSGGLSNPRGEMFPEGIAPFFIAHGTADEMVPVSALTNTEDDLDLSGIEHEIHVYEGKGHLFSAFGFPNYDAEADADSWAKLLDFLGDLTAESASQS